MPSTLTHIFIPLFILVIFSEQLKLSKKMIISLSVFAILPDLDMFLVHRETLHNIFVLIVPVIFFVILDDLKFSCVVAYYLASHIILDLFNSGVFLFYPIYQKVIYIMMGISWDHNQLIPIFEIIIQEKISGKGIFMPMISGENIATIVLIIIALISMLIYKHKSLNSSET